MQTIAAFDLGIKNLSYCVASFDASGSLVTIRRWANLNLLADGADSQAQTRCSILVGERPCGGPASWSDGARLFCKKCAKKSAKPPLVLEDKTLKGLRAAAATLGIDAKKLKKDEVTAALGAHRLLPYKAPKAKGVSLQAILAGMEACLDKELVHLATADRIRIENQPSEFAPHMKSVQMMLFVLVDHRLRREYSWKGTIEFANASVKTRGMKEAGTGKEAKRSRKLAGIAKVRETLTAAGISVAAHLDWWSAQAKQDDLADAFLMCLDGFKD